jgi:hypothetical protein
MYHVVRSRHIFLSDFAIFPIPIPFLPRSGAKKVLEVTIKLCDSFLEGRIENKLSELGTRDVEIEEVKQGKGWDEAGKRGKLRLVGDVGDIVLHET